MDKPIEGGCLCGELRYQASEQPLSRAHCHCRSCRRATGGASVPWVIFARAAVAFTHGETSIYSSSPGVEWVFCRNCGTTVAYRRDTRSTEIDITTASLDDPDAFAPTVEIWTQDKIPWVRLNDDIPHMLRVDE
jgi:hypothetical protein